MSSCSPFPSGQLKNPDGERALTEINGLEAGVEYLECTEPLPFNTKFHQPITTWAALEWNLHSEVPVLLRIRDVRNGIHQRWQRIQAVAGPFNPLHPVLNSHQRYDSTYQHFCRAGIVAFRNLLFSSSSLDLWHAIACASFSDVILDLLEDEYSAPLKIRMKDVLLWLYHTTDHDQCRLFQKLSSEIWPMAGDLTYTVQSDESWSSPNPSSLPFLFLANFICDLFDRTYRYFEFRKAEDLRLRIFDGDSPAYVQNQPQPKLQGTLHEQRDPSHNGPSLCPEVVQTRPVNFEMANEDSLIALAVANHSEQGFMEQITSFGRRDQNTCFRSARTVKINEPTGSVKRDSRPYDMRIPPRKEFASESRGRPVSGGPYKCPHCGIGIYRKYNMTRHAEQCTLPSFMIRRSGR